jgi:hypothetical protein
MRHWKAVKRVLLIAAAGMAVACMAYCAATLPAATVQLDVTRPPLTVTGAYHVHTDRSDGSGTVDDVAEAAAEAGLQFVILTDHLTAANAAHLPAPPEYRHGVLMIDAMEVSTHSGHLVALGMHTPAPYPLGGEARDVIEDVHRLGGWTVAAHPESPKPDLRWRGSATDGIEWINADSEWRTHSPGRVLLAALHSVFRPAPAIASLFGRPDTALRRWERWERTGPVVGLAAVDAHARIGLDENSEPRAARTLLARPSYVDMFRTLVQSVWLERPLTGDAVTDATQVLTSMRVGRTYSVVAAIATPGLLDVTTTGAMLRAVVHGAPEAIVSVWHDGREIASQAGEVTAARAVPGLYRIEVRWPGQQVPWIVSAPLFVPDVMLGDIPGEAAAPQTEESIPPRRTITIGAGGPWAVEHHPASSAAWRAVDQATEFSFGLARGASTGQFAALVTPLNPSESFDEVRFTVSADRPLRLSVQVRLPDDSGGGERWVRSVYADATPRDVRLRLEDFEPADRPTTRRPVAARLQSLLFVVDGPHTPPGVSGRILVSAVSLHGPSQRPDVTSGR